MDSHGSYKSKNVLADVQPGNLVNVFWKSRLIEQMGKFKIELISSVSGKIFDEKLKLQALNSICSYLSKPQLHTDFLYCPCFQNF